MKITVLTLIALTGISSAASIGLSFGGGGGGGDVTLLSADVAGVTGQTTNWNTSTSIAETNFALNDNTGANSGVTSTWTSDESWSNASGAHGTTDAGLFGGWISENSGAGNSSNINLSGISYGVYDVYVYVSHDRVGNDARITIGGDTFDIKENVDDAQLEAGTWTYTNGAGGTGNYVLFSNLSGASVDISFTTPDSDNRVGIAGVEIVQVPEPSSTALLGLGGATLLLRRKRQN